MTVARKEGSTREDLRGSKGEKKAVERRGGRMNLVTPLIVITISLLAYLYLYQAISSSEDKLTQEERYLWGNFTSWLESNGVPKIKLKLAHFEASGRGVAAAGNIEEGEAVVVIPFKVMMNSGKMKVTQLGEAILAQNTGLTDDVFLSICLLYETIRGDSFWKPYIDLLPTDFSNLPLFFTPEERKYLDGPMVEVMINQDRQLQDAYDTAARVQKEHPSFAGIADKEGLKWAISAVRSRMWTINDLPGRTLVPLADMLNHHPEKGVALDIQPDRATGTIKSNHFYSAGSEFFDKYFLTKVDSDDLYLMTFGFMLNHNDVSTYKIDFNYELATHSNIRSILDSRGCGTERDVITDSDTQLPPHLWECLCILSLDTSPDYSEITLENYHILINQKVKLRAREWANAFFEEQLEKFKKDDEQDQLLRPKLTNNMRNILLVRKSEKKVLRHAGHPEEKRSRKTAKSRT